MRLLDDIAPALSPPSRAPRIPGASRPTSGRREVVYGLGAYAAYLAVRAAVMTPDGLRTARRNAEAVLAVERRWNLDVERGLQRRLQAFPRLARALSASYAAFNVTGSVAWLMWLYARGDPMFVRERRAALAAFFGSLPVFWAMPTAPPRTLPGFVDTVAAGGLNLDAPLLLRFYNPISAMPSQHMAFAVVTGSAISGRLRGRPARLAAQCYPPLVALIVLSTANHFLLDVVAGVALGAAAWRFTR